MRNILIEGCDGTGKSTLAKQISERLHARHPTKGFLHFHNGVYPSINDALISYQRQIKKTHKDKIIIWDRAHISSLVYGLVYHHEIPTKKDFQFVDALFAEETLLLFCNPTIQTTLNNWYSNIDNELVRNEDQIRTIHSIYEYIIHKVTDMKFLEYDYERDNLNFLNAIIEIFEE